MERRSYRNRTVVGQEEGEREGERGKDGGMDKRKEGQREGGERERERIDYLHVLWVGSSPSY